MPKDKNETIAIYWDDLTESKQNELLRAFGDNHNYDVFPIAEIIVQTEEETL